MDPELSLKVETKEILIEFKMKNLDWSRKDSTLEGVYKENGKREGFRTWLDGITTENFFPQERV